MAIATFAFGLFGELPGTKLTAIENNDRSKKSCKKCRRSVGFRVCSVGVVGGLAARTQAARGGPEPWPELQMLRADVAIIGTLAALRSEEPFIWTWLSSAGLEWIHLGLGMSGAMWRLPLCSVVSCIVQIWRKSRPIIPGHIGFFPGKD